MKILLQNLYIFLMGYNSILNQADLDVLKSAFMFVCMCVTVCLLYDVGLCGHCHVVISQF